MCDNTHSDFLLILRSPKTTEFPYCFTTDIFGDVYGCSQIDKHIFNREKLIYFKDCIYRYRKYRQWMDVFLDNNYKILENNNFRIDEFLRLKKALDGC